MSRWLEIALKDVVPKLPKSPKSAREPNFGDFGTFGTAPEKTASPLPEGTLEADAAAWLARLEGQPNALERLRVRLLNDARLAVPQANASRCLICGRTEREGAALIPVLSASGTPNWMHGTVCHREHVARQRGKAGAVLRSIGIEAENAR